MNTSDIILLAAVGCAIVAAVIYSFYSRTKRGGGCGCGCSGCTKSRCDSSRAEKSKKGENSNK